MRAFVCLAAIIGLASCNGAPPSPPTPQPPPPTPAPPPPPTSNVTLVNMIPATLSGETNQDSEPFLAVSRTNPDRMAASAFTPNPFGTVSGLAPIYVSQDGGRSWTLNNIVRSAGSLGTSDITIATRGDRHLYAGILRVPGSLLLNTLESMDFTAPTPMDVLENRTRVDQPFVQAMTVTGQNRVYVGNNDFMANGGRTASVDLSLDGGATFQTARIETRNTSGQDGPSIRPAIANDGTVYAAFFRWKSFNGSIAVADVTIVRDDDGGVGGNAFGDLTDPSDNRSGRIIAQDVQIPWSNAPTLGQERIGSTLSVGVHPTDSDIVYVAWADRVGNDIYTVHLRRSVDRGVTWSGDLRTISNATCISVAVAESGAVGFLYQQLVGSGSSARWETHVEQSRDRFATVHEDRTLARTPSNTPQAQFLPYLGDYNFLLAVGGEFRGIFSANNQPINQNFPEGVTFQRAADFNSGTLNDGQGNNVPISIDPFYFSIPENRP